MKKTESLPSHQGGPQILSGKQLDFHLSPPKWVGSGVRGVDLWFWALGCLGACGRGVMVLWDLYGELTLSGFG